MHRGLAGLQQYIQHLLSNKSPHRQHANQAATWLHVRISPGVSSCWTCSILRVMQKKGSMVCMWLQGDSRLVTAAGDHTLAVWDTAHARQDLVCRGHRGSVKAVTRHSANPHIFASGAALQIDFSMSRAKFRHQMFVPSLYASWLLFHSSTSVACLSLVEKGGERSSCAMSQVCCNCAYAVTGRFGENVLQYFFWENTHNTGAFVGRRKAWHEATSALCMPESAALLGRMASAACARSL